MRRRKTDWSNHLFHLSLSMRVLSLKHHHRETSRSILWRRMIFDSTDLWKKRKTLSRERLSSFHLRAHGRQQRAQAAGGARSSRKQQCVQEHMRRAQKKRWWCYAARAREWSRRKTIQYPHNIDEITNNHHHIISVSIIYYANNIYTRYSATLCSRCASRVIESALKSARYGARETFSLAIEYFLCVMVARIISCVTENIWQPYELHI